MYEVVEISLGNLTRLYQYHLTGIFGAGLNLKGFDYPWLISSRSWKTGEKVLDIGAAYSALPIHIQKTYGCEVWVADDYGMNSNEPFWKRGKKPQEHISGHPEIRFITERLGDPARSSLPAGYFNVLYSLSTLEHVPTPLVPAVWRHMDSLIKPGGEMFHAIDIPFPSNQGWKKVLQGILYDFLYPLFSKGHHYYHYMSTPQAHARFVSHILEVHASLPKGLSVLNLVFNPDVMSEGYEVGLNRIQKDGIGDFNYQRTGTLLIRLRKVA